MHERMTELMIMGGESGLAEQVQRIPPAELMDLMAAEGSQEEVAHLREYLMRRGGNPPILVAASFDGAAIGLPGDLQRGAGSIGSSDGIIFGRASPTYIPLSSSSNNGNGGGMINSSSSNSNSRHRRRSKGALGSGRSGCGRGGFVLHHPPLSHAESSGAHARL